MTDNIVIINASERNSIIGDVDTSPSIDVLLQILECPICAEYPSPPIFSCARGHFICKSCVELLDVCIICQSNFTGARNFALEAIVENTRFVCRYRDDGCFQSVLGKEYMKHVDGCLYRPLRCRENKNSPCYLGIFSPETYLDHLITSHVTDGETINFGLPKFGSFTQTLGIVYPTIYVKLNGRQKKSFLLHTKQHKTFVCWWVTSLSVKDKGRRAILTWTKVPLHPTSQIAPCSAHFDNVIKWKVPIQHENQLFEEILDMGNCAVLPLRQLIQFMIRKESKDEPRWIIGLDLDLETPTVVNDVKNSDFQQQKKKYGIPTWAMIKHYSPLIALIFIGIMICAYYRNQENESHVTDIEYYGYRGFYYPTRSQKRGEL